MPYHQEHPLVHTQAVVRISGLYKHRPGNLRASDWDNRLNLAVLSSSYVSVSSSFPFVCLTPLVVDFGSMEVLFLQIKSSHNNDTFPGGDVMWEHRVGTQTIRSMCKKSDKIEGVCNKRNMLRSWIVMFHRRIGVYICFQFPEFPREGGFWSSRSSGLHVPTRNHLLIQCCFESHNENWKLPFQVLM